MYICMHYVCLYVLMSLCERGEREEAGGEEKRSAMGLGHGAMWEASRRRMLVRLQGKSKRESQ